MTLDAAFCAGRDQERRAVVAALPQWRTICQSGEQVGEAAVEVQPAKLRVTSMPLTGHRILLVEDEVLIAFEIRRSLQAAHGEVVGPASTVAKAIKLADTHNLSLAVLDFRLRFENSFAGSREIARDRCALYFLYCQRARSIAGGVARRTRYLQTSLANHIGKSFGVCAKRVLPHGWVESGMSEL